MSKMCFMYITLHILYIYLIVFFCTDIFFSSIKNRNVSQNKGMHAFKSC